METVTATTLKDEGMQRAADHADAVVQTWSERAFDLFKRYAQIHRLFMTEDVRLWAQSNRLLEEPPDRRAWGSIAAKAVKHQLVAVSHFAPQKDRRSHGSPKPMWHSLNFPKKKSLEQVEMFS